MNNIFAMVTLKSSNNYTKFALESFFQNTEIKKDDEFLLINNDYCDTERYLSFNKIKILKNSKPYSFAENVNQAIKRALHKKKNLIFLNNDIIFTHDWFVPLKSELRNVSIPVSNQLFSYSSECNTLKLSATMNFDQFNKKFDLLNTLVTKHKEKFGFGKKFQAPLMPFFCFKVPYQILNEVGYFDDTFGKGGGEDIDYRIRCAIKGYEVNFLLDSYLLHFHGKSTWDGGESLDQIEERNQKYIKVFIKKWGNELSQLFILRKNFSTILSEKGLEDLYKNGKFGDLIRKLC
jgi:O-antigen biosynthesis protein